MIVFVVFPLIFIISFIILFVLFDTCYHYLLQVKEKGKPVTIKVKVKKKGFFRSLLFDFPHCLARYIYDSQGIFDEYGIVIFYGPQGCGKSMGVSHYANELRKKYPTAIVGSNYDLSFQDFEIKDWKTLCTVKNKDEKGNNLPIIFCFDEINQWAFSRDWQSMPKNAISEMAYQRKNKRVILGTAQSIGQIDRQIRIQCASGEYRRVFCLLDFINIVVRFKPNFDENGDCRKKSLIGAYMFLQTDEFRTFYDTNKTIERLANKKDDENKKE